MAFISSLPPPAPTAKMSTHSAPHLWRRPGECSKAGVGGAAATVVTGAGVHHLRQPHIADFRLGFLNVAGSKLSDS